VAHNQKTSEAGTVVSLHYPTGYFAEASVNHTGRQCSLPAQDTLPGWHYRAAFRHAVFEPMDFLARLAALVPKPRVNLTRFHGVFAGTPDRANSRFRSEVTPGRRGKQSGRLEKTPAERGRAMNCTRGHKGTATQAGIQYLC